MSIDIEASAREVRKVGYTILPGHLPRALMAACNDGGPVIPVFIEDSAVLGRGGAALAKATREAPTPAAAPPLPVTTPLSSVEKPKPFGPLAMVTILFACAST